MQPRTKRQREVFDYITRFVGQHGYEPSYQQIARHFRIASKSAIAKHIVALENQGLLKRRRENGSFGLHVQSAYTLSEMVCQVDWLELPGDEFVKEKWEKEPLFLPRPLLGKFSSDRAALFRVGDDRMIGEHICAGDAAIVERQTYARDGEIIVALLEKQMILLAKFFRRGAGVELRAANPKYDPVHLPADRVSILGVLRGVLRPAI